MYKKALNKRITAVIAALILSMTVSFTACENNRKARLAEFKNYNYESHEQEENDKEEDNKSKENYYLKKTPIKLYEGICTNYEDCTIVGACGPMAEINYAIPENLKVLDVNGELAKVSITGYIPSWYLSKYKDDDIEPTKENDMYIINDTCMRIAPEEKAHIAQKLESGTAVKIKEVYEGLYHDTWYFVQLNIIGAAEPLNEGWIKREELGNLEALLNFRKNHKENCNEENLYTGIDVKVKKGAEELDYEGNFIEINDHEYWGEIYEIKEINGEKIYQLRLPGACLSYVREKDIEFVNEIKDVNMSSSSEEEEKNKNNEQNIFSESLTYIEPKDNGECIFEKGMEFYKNLIKDEKGRVIRAKGECELGNIIITAREPKEVSVVEEFSNLNRKGDIITTNDFNVIYINNKGEETVITNFNDMLINHPINNTTRLKTFQYDDGYLFGFIPDYMDGCGYPFYMFGINRKGECFQVNFRTKFYDGIIDIKDSISLIRNELNGEYGLLKVITPMPLEHVYHRGKFEAYYKFNKEYKIFDLVKYERK